VVRKTPAFGNNYYAYISQSTPMNSKRVDISGQLNSVFGAWTVYLVPSLTTKNVTQGYFYDTKANTCDKFSSPASIDNCFPPDSQPGLLLNIGVEPSQQWSWIDSDNISNILTISNSAVAMYPPIIILRTTTGSPFNTTEEAIYFNYTKQTFNNSFFTPPSICTSSHSELSQSVAPFVRRFAFI